MRISLEEIIIYAGMVAIVFGFSAFCLSILASQGITVSSAVGQCPEGEISYNSRCIDRSVNQSVESYLQKNGETVVGKISADLDLPEWRVQLTGDRLKNVSCYRTSEVIYACSMPGRIQ